MKATMNKSIISVIVLILMTALIVGVAIDINANTKNVLAESNTLFIQTDTLNKPIYDDTNYYINIKAPKIFASNGNVLAVMQNNNIVVKVDTNIEYIIGGAMYNEGKDSYELKAINIDRHVNGNNEYGYIYLTYYKGEFIYKTIIYKYSIPQTNASDSSTLLQKLGDFREYFKDRKIDVAQEILDDINPHVSDISISDGILYLLSKKNGNVYKVTNLSIAKLALPSETTPFLTVASEFAINDNGDVYVYGRPDNASSIYKSTNTSTGYTKFVEFDAVEGIIDMAVSGNYLYLLTDNELKVMSTSYDKNSGDTSNKYVFTEDFKKNDTDGATKCISFNLNSIDGVNYLSFALEGNDNILTYKERKVDTKLALEFFNHYGANCTCETPHKGWLNSPSSVAVNNSESTVYVADNSNKRLVIMVDKTKGNFEQYFFNIDTLNVPSIDGIEVDRLDRIYLVSGDKLFVYLNNNVYDDKDISPLSRQDEISGFDGKIVDTYMNNTNESTLYILTDKNSVYMLSDGSRTPKKLLTSSEKLVSIASTYKNDRIYLASKNAIKSFVIKDFNSGAPLTTLSLEDEILDIIVDYAGNIFTLTKDSKLQKHIRVEDNTYVASKKYMSINGWSNLSDIKVSRKSKNFYFVDSATHLLERTPDSPTIKTLGYVNDTDKYVPDTVLDTSLLYVGKTTSETRVYDAPNNFEKYRVAPKGEYFYILANDKTNNDMYYVVDSNNNMQYIKKAFIEKVEATKDSTIGDTFMPLFGSVGTKVYKYPFDKAKVIDTTFDTMILVDNVAFDNGKNVWQNETSKWFKVSYTTSVGASITGYVKMNEITVKSSVTAPSNKIHLRVKPAIGETAVMFDLPDSASGILMSDIVNGQLVRLMQESFNEDSIFTRVMIKTDNGEVVGYMYTRDLQENTLTALQIMAIVLSVITFVTTILIIILAVHYKKKKSDENIFKKDKDEE